MYAFRPCTPFLCSILLPALLAAAPAKAPTQAPGKAKANPRVEAWVTHLDQSALIQRQAHPLPPAQAMSGDPVIEVDEGQTFQTMDGFGCCLTGGSAILLHRMKPAARAALLKELFSPKGQGIGISYLRVSIGASDLSDHVFTYNDLPPGETDPEMKRFSMAKEQQDLLPILKQILAIQPGIKLLASPWTPPVWMKTSSQSKGGSLKPECYDAYARYFVKYIQAMKAQGVRIEAITVQNEPLHPGNNPSLLMPAQEQAAFIKQSLGPAFRAAGLDTKILIYDHNADRTDYPLTVLKDPEAAQYVDGTAFHLYAGSIEALSEVHAAHPDKHLYFTEQWVGAPGNFAGDFTWHVRTLMIGATRNWCRNVLEWNLAADPKQGPHTEGGCTECLGAITLGEGDKVTRNPAYYVIGQISKFVRPGSVRIASTVPGKLHNVAFRTPEGALALLVQNDGPAQTFVIRHRGQSVAASLPAGSVATYLWK